MILIYINATSMTSNGIMTLCKHRLVLSINILKFKQTSPYKILKTQNTQHSFI